MIVLIVALKTSLVTYPDKSTSVCTSPIFSQIYLA
nr:MAG TPA: hypothetical protein [Caudoviricetes sp.]